MTYQAILKKNDYGSICLYGKNTIDNREWLINGAYIALESEREYIIECAKKHAQRQKITTLIVAADIHPSGETTTYNLGGDEQE